MVLTVKVGNAYTEVNMNMRKKTDSYHHGFLRKAIIELALQKLDEGIPVQDISVRALAVELGVSKDAPRKHFQTSDNLIAALAVSGFRILGDTLSSIQADDLVGLGIAYIQFAIDHPQLYRTMFYFPAERHQEFEDLQNAAGQTFSYLTKSIEMHRKSKKRSYISYKEASISAWAFVHGISDLLIQGLFTTISSADTDKLTRIVRAFVSNGL